MAPLTILIAVGREDRDRVEGIADTVRKIVGDRESRVVVSHVLTESEYEDAIEALVPQVDTSREPMSAVRPETSAAHSGSSGESSRSTESQISPEAAVQRAVSQQTVVRDLVEALREVDIDPEILGRVGDPAERVVAMTADLDADFVVIGGRDRSPTTQAVFGSVSREILRSAACPAISVRKGVDET